MKKEKGITLIVLVVTVVVLLILAGITIPLLIGDSSIIKQAREGKEQTEIGEEREKVNVSATLAAREDTWGRLTEENFAKELDEQIGPRDEKYTLTLDEENEQFIVKYLESGRVYYIDAEPEPKVPEMPETTDKRELKVGDYVDYEPDEVTTPYKLTSANTGYESDQSISQEDIRWQILRIYEDGRIDLIGSANTSNVYVCLRGAPGYNNGVYLLNDLCETLYSRKSDGITARSVNLEDFDKWLTEEGKRERNIYNIEVVQYGKTNTYTDSSYRKYPHLYQYENGSGIDLDIQDANNPPVKTGGLGVSDYIKGDDTEKKYTNGLTTQTYSIASNGLTVTQTFYSIEINETNYGEGSKVLWHTSPYWLASRYTKCYNYEVRFGLGVASYECSGRKPFVLL